MSRYIEWDDVQNAYPDWGKAVSANTVGNLWIPRAEDEVDARLAPKYSVPFNPVPGIVRDLCIDLAYFKLAFATEKGEKLGKILEARFKAILNGNMLITNSTGQIDTGERAWSSHENYPTQFGVDSDINWRVSSAWAQDQQEARGQI